MPISQQILFKSLLSRHESKNKYLKYAILSVLKQQDAFTVKEINIQLHKSGYDGPDRYIQQAIGELWHDQKVISVSISGQTVFLGI